MVNPHATLRMMMTTAVMHQFVRLGRIQKIGQCFAQFSEIYRFGDVVVESRLHTLVNHVGHHVGREGNDGCHLPLCVVMVVLPFSDFTTRLIPILVGHMKVAYDHGIVAMVVAKDLVGAFNTVRHGFHIYRDLTEKFSGAPFD